MIQSICKVLANLNYYRLVGQKLDGFPTYQDQREGILKSHEILTAELAEAAEKRIPTKDACCLSAVFRSYLKNI
jgi:hypothetical protein